MDRTGEKCEIREMRSVGGGDRCRLGVVQLEARSLSNGCARENRRCVERNGRREQRGEACSSHRETSARKRHVEPTSAPESCALAHLMRESLNDKRVNGRDAALLIV